MKPTRMTSVITTLVNQNDYYKVLDIPAQIARLNNLTKLQTDEVKFPALVAAGTPLCSVALAKLIQKSEERLFTSINLLYLLEEEVSYDALDDLVSELMPKGDGKQS